jgi:hypothetical protein
MNFAARLIRECSRIMAILILGVVAGIVVWFAAAWVFLTIVSAVWPQVRANDVVWPSGPQLLAMGFVLLAMPVFVIAGGWIGWCFATKEKG